MEKFKKIIKIIIIIALVVLIIDIIAYVSMPEDLKKLQSATREEKKKYLKKSIKSF